MKTIAICSLVSLALVSFPIAASAANEVHPLVTVREAGKPVGGSRTSHVVIGKPAGGGRTVGNAGARTIGGSDHFDVSIADTAREKGQAKGTVANLHLLTAAASHKLQEAGSGISVSFAAFNTSYEAAMATPANTRSERRQNAALSKTQHALRQNITRINTSIARLPRARSAKDAAIECDSIKKSAQKAIDTLRRDIVDLEATKLIVQGDMKAGNALLVRGRRIENEKKLLVSFQKLASMADTQAQAFRSLPPQDQVRGGVVLPLGQQQAQQEATRAQ